MEKTWRRCRTLSTFVGPILAATVFTAWWSHRGASAMEVEGHSAPDVAGFVLVGEEDGDGDGDGIKETHIRHYENRVGDRVFSMTTQGKVWAWSLASHPAAGAADPTSNYVIRDSNCDGAFDERYSLDEEFHVPDCLR